MRLLRHIKDKRAEQALARLNSETFRKQFTQADVTSVDKMVSCRPAQAQVLFSMQVVPATRGAKKREEQAVATLVADGDQVLVCQYVLKSAVSTKGLRGFNLGSTACRDVICAM